ncbi:MAG: phage integrase SAM-like domain-containing protein [Phocaeicola sp.]
MEAKKRTTSIQSKKEPIKLREKVLADGSKSLYLDIYRNGKRVREFLKLYITTGKSPIDKEQNKQTLSTAQAIKAKRQIEMQNGEYNFTNQFKVNTPFLEYYRKMCDNRKGNIESRGNWGNWYSCLRHLERYCTEKTTFKDVDKEFIEGFKDYLNNVAKDAYKRRNNDLAEAKPLSQNSKCSYFNKLIACINQAFEERIIPINPSRGVKRLEAGETERVYLTLEEVKKLAKTPCKYEVLKRAFLFSCLTGLRKSDVEKMVWDEIQTFGEFKRIVFKQKKTKGQEYLDINKQAEEFLGVQGKATDRVFGGFRYNAQTLLELRRWVLLAGITKDVTYHASRHTFAVVMLDLGADIYTVSKLLGHKELKTTQIYGKVLDKKKQEAINLIPNINE